MNKVVKRTVTGISVGAGVIALFLFAPLKTLPPVLLVLSTLVQLEFYQMAKAYKPVTRLGLLMGAAWLGAVAAFPTGAGTARLLSCLPVAGAGATFLLSLVVLFRARYERPIGSLAVTLAGFFYVPFLLSFFLRVVQIGAPEGLFAMPASRAGLYTLLCLIAVAKFSDTGGFAFGLSFGRHKMCPTISPNKSWEGLFGSMVFAAATACVFLALARHFGWAATIPLWGRVSYIEAVCGGAVLALVATGCDLIESRFKRECGVKDSATFMPAGMGGFLDMFDSILFIPALVYPFLVAHG